MSDYLFQDEEEPLEGNPEDYEIRKMDCMDCHNRPSHLYKSPREIMNALMVRKEVSDQIPEIRSVGADAMAAEYATTQGAIDSIRLTIQQYYQENYPEQVNEFKPLLDSAITAIIDEYQI